MSFKLKLNFLRTLERKIQYKFHLFLSIFCDIWQQLTSQFKHYTTMCCHQYTIHTTRPIQNRIHNWQRTNRCGPACFPLFVIFKLRERSFYVYLCWSVGRLVGLSKKCKKCKKWGIQPMSANINCFDGGIDLRIFYTWFFLYVCPSDCFFY